MGQNWQEAEVIKTPSWDSNFDLCEADCLEQACLLDMWTDSDLPKAAWRCHPCGQYLSLQAQQPPLISHHLELRWRRWHRSHLCAKRTGNTSLSHVSWCWGWDFHAAMGVWWFSSWLRQNRGSEGNSDMWAKLLLCGPTPSLCPSLHTCIYQSELLRAVLIRANIPDARTCPLPG